MRQISLLVASLWGVFELVTPGAIPGISFVQTNDKYQSGAAF